MSQHGFWNWGRAAQAPVSRRAFVRSLGGLALASVTGCAQRFGMRKCELAADMPMPDIVAHLNQNIDQINSWRCTGVKLTAQGGMMLAPSVSASMAVERPRNFRLQARAVTIDVADMGSNNERFWCWVKNDEDPVILTARHECLQAAQQQMPLPFEPDWLIEALGVIPIDEQEVEFEKHATEPKRVNFRRQRKAPDGSPVELVSTVDTCHGVFVEHRLLTRTGQVIALAKMGEHLRDGKSGVVLPHQVELSWPDTKMGLNIRMGAIEINPETLSEKLFEMPTIADCRVYDMGGETQQATHTGRSKV